MNGRSARVTKETAGDGTLRWSTWKAPLTTPPDTSNVLFAPTGQIRLILG
jgi:hypothetical protein